MKHFFTLNVQYNYCDILFITYNNETELHQRNDKEFFTKKYNKDVKFVNLVCLI